MQDKIWSKLNLYDQVGYLMVGGTALLTGAFNFYLLEKASLLPAFNLQYFIIWFLFAYFAGHVVQAIANVVIKENKTEFTESEKEILTNAQKYFGLEKQSLNEVYLLCYLTASAKDIAGQVQSFNAYYSLYRGWLAIFVMESVFLFILVIAKWFDLWLCISLVVSLLLAVLFLRRSRRFYAYSRAKSLQTFVLVQKLGL